MNRSPWWKRLLRPKPKEPIFTTGDLGLFSSGQTALRAETALPGTNRLKPIVILVPPPVNFPSDYYADMADRDYLPCPPAEWSLTFEAEKPFNCKKLQKELGISEQFSNPTFYVRTPKGNTTYLISSDAPKRGTALIPAWSLAPWGKQDIQSIFAGAEKLAAKLATLGFQQPAVLMQELEKQHSQVAKVISIAPQEITIIASHPEDGFWPGRAVWDLLHQLNFTWGDMDCFQWADITGQTDYLIWAEVDDGELGYALPERIADRTQHFRAIRFSFNILRSPAPEHVMTQLARVVAVCQQSLECGLTAYVDETVVNGEDDLFTAITEAEQKLAAVGLKPGCGAVCQII